MATSRWRVALIFLLLSAACGTATAPVGLGTDATRTGLEGTVRRGPTQPVCRVDQPCDEPFAANFEVRRDDAVVAHFTSGMDGHFSVRLSPGRYTVVPDAGAPVMNPAAQAREVVVGSDGLTHVELEFDTGIR
jgi:hypothetical protein